MVSAETETETRVLVYHYFFGHYILETSSNPRLFLSAMYMTQQTDGTSLFTCLILRSYIKEQCQLFRSI